ncbi:MAG: AI-2E family transporter [Synergistes sp.]|nr:AI-2E family transporter [Synergistes sp.]
MNKLNDSSDKMRSGKFLVFFAIFAFIAWKIASPLMSDIIWAVMIAFFATPFNNLLLKKVLHGKCKTLAAVLTLLSVTVVLIMPMVIIIGEIGTDAANVSSLLLDSVKELTSAASSGGGEQLIKSCLPHWATKYVQNVFNIEYLASLAQNAALYIGGLLTEITPRIVTVGSEALLNVLITLMLSFFFIRDGKKIFFELGRYIPMPEDEKKEFCKEIVCDMNSVMYGMVITVVIQAVLCTVGWWYAGLSNALLFGVIMFFVGMLPSGTALIWIPGAIYLAACGNYSNAAILFVWGCAVVGVTDSLMRPLLMSCSGSSDDSSTLLVTIGLFGGVMAFGFLGIFIGPLILMLFRSVCRIYVKYN